MLTTFSGTVSGQVRQVLLYMITALITVAARSKLWICGLSLPGVSGSNPA